VTLAVDKGEQRMLTGTQLGFIGSGNMAEAMIRGLLERHLVEPAQIVGSGPRRARGEALQQQYGIETTTDNRAAAEHADILVLSVKPQVLPRVLHELRGHLRPGVLVLSIVAGARIRSITHGLGQGRIVRAMPNTPAQLGKGMTVWTATELVDPERRTHAQAILGALGEELYVEDEVYLDMATALSGTGPAYVFLFMEALIDAGVHMGFSRHVAERLVLQTIEGSLAMARASKKHPAVLRNMVTSPGGTSAEALYQLEKGTFRTVVSKAIWAAFRKSQYLGDLSEEGIE